MQPALKIQECVSPIELSRIAVSVIVVTRNEEARIGLCLAALQRFDDIWVLDSASSDHTKDVSYKSGAQVKDFKWNGQYPKKRQWALENLSLKYGRVFFVDADEIVSAALCDEIAALDWVCAGYFVRGLYRFDGQILRYGLSNNKLCLIDRTCIEFPVVNDLGLEGMGEIEGHYQPVLKRGYADAKIGQLQTPMVHEAYEDQAGWEARHQRYAAWEAGMNLRRAWPRDPDFKREILKRIFRAMPMRGAIAFLQSYVFKLGFLDGRAGYEFAKTRMRYYRMIAARRDFIDQ
jgi:glycosyltransferase involved in cell wall biosynthesis